MLWRNILEAEIGARGHYPAVLLRIMTNHMQLITLVQSLRLEWPHFVLQYYDAQERIGSTTEMALNLDCVVDRDRISPVYANLIGITVMPVILMIISVFIWTMIKIFRSKMLWTKYVHYTEGTIINILFLVHPAILKTTMQLYACTNIEGTFYLDIFMDDKCWSGDHKQYAVTVAFPGLILWGLGLPFMAFYKLKKLNNQRLLKIKEKKEVYGFLYLGYSRQKYWWELVILSRKVIILIALIWLNRISVVI